MPVINPSMLLGRPEFELDTEPVIKTTVGRTILVTGAGGSIGSEICRQVTHLAPDKILLLGRGENSIYQIERELQNCGAEVVGIIGDIQNKARLESVFKEHSPEIVYHAAASKHVPLMENNPTEAVLNNIIGTKNLVDMAHKYGVNSFVMISTDKAVRPSSVMGASKRIAELLVQSMNSSSNTRFSIVRFGNVLGSRGSVVPLFQEQIDKGGPITITDKEMTRFFMTIPEASKLVIQAGAFAAGGEIFILDMGEPIKVYDLAMKMIEFSGRYDIDIVEVGVRPGEKIHEELLSQHEVASDMVLPKTFVSTSKPRKKEEVLSIITSLFGLDNLDLKRAILYEANH